MTTVPKKPLFLVLSKLGPLSLHNRTSYDNRTIENLRLQIVFKSQNKLVNPFHFKDYIPKELTSGVVYKFQCVLCNESYYGKCVRHINERIGEHIRISRLTKKKVNLLG